MDKYIVMYTAKPIPTLTGNAADRFEKAMSKSSPRIDMREAFITFDTIMQRSVI